MPQYAFTINGQRHVFEGPDPQTTAQFAQRWAAAQASARTPASENGNRLQMGQKRSQFAADLGARAKQDVADLDRAIDQVKAHPANLLNGPRIISAVGRYIPNAFGLLPAAAVDQVTGPVVRGINSRFGSHFDPRYATDQILNAASLLLSGAGEASAAESSLAGGGETSDVQHPLTNPEMSAQHAPAGPAEPPHATTRASKQPQPNPSRPKPNLTVAYTAPDLHDQVLGQNSGSEKVVPLSDGFTFNHEQRMKSLEDLPEDTQDKYHSAIANLIINPILDDPDYQGHNAAAVENIRRELATMADEQRTSGGNARLANALDAANEDFRVEVNQWQPEMAKELGLTRPGDSRSDASSTSETDTSQTGARGELINFSQHVPPPKVIDPYANLDIDYYGEDIGDYLRQVRKEWGPGRVSDMLNAWKAIDETANDNAPLPNWAGRVKPQKPINYPLAEDFEPWPPLRDTMTEEEKQTWMKTAANDNGPQVAGEDLQKYLNELWNAPRRPSPAARNAPRTPLRIVWSAPQPNPTNAFSGAPSGPVSPDWTTVPRAPGEANELDFNSLRPWFGPAVVGAANQPKDPFPQQPQN